MPIAFEFSQHQQPALCAKNMPFVFKMCAMYWLAKGEDP